MRPVPVLLLLVLQAGCAARGPEAVTDVTRAHYVWGPEVNVLSPCGSTLEYWVSASESLYERLVKQYRAFELPPYSSVYVEVGGAIAEVLDCEFCQEYDGSFRIDELMLVESPGPESCSTEIGGAPQGNGA